MLLGEVDEVLHAAMRMGEMLIQTVRGSAGVARMILSLYRRRAAGAQLPASELRGRDIRSFHLPRASLAQFRRFADGIGLSFAAQEEPDRKRVTVSVSRGSFPAALDVCRTLGMEPDLRDAQPEPEAPDAGLMDQETEAGGEYCTMRLAPGELPQFLRKADAQDLAYAVPSWVKTDPAAYLRRGEILKEGIPPLGDGKARAGGPLRRNHEDVRACILSNQAFSDLSERLHGRVLLTAVRGGPGSVLVTYRARDSGLVRNACPQVRPLRSVTLGDLRGRMETELSGTALDILVPRRELARARDILDAGKPGRAREAVTAARALRAVLTRSRLPLDLRLARARQAAAAGPAPERARGAQPARGEAR